MVKQVAPFSQAGIAAYGDGRVTVEDTHFEVFHKKHQKASWTLIQASHDRREALDLAEKLKSKHAKGSVRVVREVWIPGENEFRGSTIFESGPERFANPEEKTGEASIPCLTPDDLAGPAARETVRRVLSPWLERRQVCPMELLYRPDLIEELDGTDSDLQHAIQKVAIARAQGSDASVHAYVRLINDLVQRAVNQTLKEARSGKTLPKTDSFAETAEKILSEGGPEKRMRRAIAERLSKARELGAKADLLLDMHDDLPADPQARAFAAEQTDLFLAEILSFAAAVEKILGQTGDIGEQIERLASVYEGRANTPELNGAPGSARRLAEKFSRREMPASHGEIAGRILDMLRSPKRFRPASVMKEIELARRLARRLIAASGPNLNPEALVEAFTHRSARLLAPEAIDEALEGAADPPGQIERLFSMEDNIVGDMNKKKLAAYIRARLKTNSTETWFVRGPGAPLQRLQTLAELQKRALKGTFPAGDKHELSAAFDHLGMAVLEETKLFARVAAREGPALEKAVTLLKLAAGGVLPEGACVQDAQARALRLIGSAEGRAGLASPEGRAKLAEIQTLLAAIRPPEPPEPDASEEADAQAEGESEESGGAESGDAISETGAEVQAREAGAA